MKATMLTLGALAGLLACGVAAAQFRNAGKAVDYRQAALTVMDTHFDRIGAMVHGKTPFDAKAAQADAELVVTLAKLPWAAFVDGSDKGDTGARPEIWTQRAKFDADAQALQDATVKLLAAARSGNPDALGTAFGATAQTCKSCHDDFRKKH